MSDASSLLSRSASELSALLKRGEVSSRELVEASLSRIEALNPRVNAFTLIDADRALEAADRIARDDPRPFAGVPIAIKDLFTPVAGLRQTNCSELADDGTVSTIDASTVRRLRDAGFVIVGLTNSPEFGILPVTEPRRNGPTRNPWDLERTPGGSSGGTAAAVASGMVPLGHASDGGGSIRIPAACCGLVGLKASRGRISRAPTLGEHLLSTDGVLTRTVADSAALLDVLAGYEPGDATWAPPPQEPYAAAAARAPGRLRIGLYTESPIGTELDPACVQAAHDAAALLASLGHEIVDGPALTVQDILPVFTVLWAANVGVSVVGTALLSGREVQESDVEPLSWALYQQALATDTVALNLATIQLQAMARGIVGTFAAYDVLLTPALAERPVAIGEIDACSQGPMADFARSAAFTPYTAIWNVTGQPAISVPLYQGEDGLPTAVQLVGRPVSEDTLLALAAQLEAANPWADRLAPVALERAPA
ncbi:MAG: amidase [Solirubrobacteraceae bacterium]|nr:MAG: amidase [Solirubrobacterales bacterium]